MAFNFSATLISGWHIYARTPSNITYLPILLTTNATILCLFHIQLTASKTVYVNGALLKWDISTRIYANDIIMFNKFPIQNNDINETINNDDLSIYMLMHASIEPKPDNKPQIPKSLREIPLAATASENDLVKHQNWIETTKEKSKKFGQKERTEYILKAIQEKRVECATLWEKPASPKKRKLTTETESFRKQLLAAIQEIPSEKLLTFHFVCRQNNSSSTLLLSDDMDRAYDVCFTLEICLFVFFCFTKLHVFFNQIYFQQLINDFTASEEIAKIVTTDQCIELSEKFTEKDIVIFEEFNGDCFDKISKTRAR